MGVALLLVLNLTAWGIIFDVRAGSVEGDAQALHGELARIQESLDSSEARLMRIEAFLLSLDWETDRGDATISMDGDAAISMDGDSSIHMDTK